MHIDDVARWISEVVPRPIKPITISHVLKDSLPADPPHRLRVGRYAGKPAPAPDRYRGTVPQWAARDDEELYRLKREWQTWWRDSHPGHGHGGGRPRRGTEQQPVPQPAPRQPRQDTPEGGDT